MSAATTHVELPKTNTTNSEDARVYSDSIHRPTHRHTDESTNAMAQAAKTRHTQQAADVRCTRRNEFHK